MISSRAPMHRRLLPALVAVLSLAASDLKPARGVANAIPQWFDFIATLQSPVVANEERPLLKGALLYPTVAGAPWPHQPIVLCEDLRPYFDAHGVSGPVRIQGFCMAAGLEAVLRSSGGQWKITAAVVSQIAATRLCDLALQKAIREGQRGHKGPWHLGPPDWHDLCHNDIQKCMDGWEHQVRQLFPQESLASLTGKETCAITPEFESGIHLIECWREKGT